MPAGVSMDEYAEKTRIGMYKAQEAYEKWSGGLWAWSAPEYLLTTYIAQEISKIKKRNFYLTLEQHVGEALEAAGASENDVKSVGRQKFDIMVWWGGDAPRGIIEVKKQVNSFGGGATGYGGIKKDVERIIVSLEATSRIQFGLIAYYTSCKYGVRPPKTAKERITDRAQNISSEARKFVQERDRKFKRIDGKIIEFKDETVKEGPNGHAWVAEVLMIWGR